MTETTDSNKKSDGGKKSDDKPAPERGRVKGFLLGAPKFHLVVIVLLLASTLVFAVWRSISIAMLEDEIAGVTRKARAAMVAQSGELLQLSAVPLAWAIRAEILANDIGDIDAYMQKLVQEKHVKRIVFIDASGKIVASTNTKLKDQDATTALPGLALVATSPRVEQAGADLRMIVPVMDFERQIGTLVLEYSSTQAIDAKLTK